MNLKIRNGKQSSMLKSHTKTEYMSKNSIHKLEQILRIQLENQNFKIEISQKWRV